MAKKIKAKFIFEMLGKPPEYLKESLENHIKSLENDDIKIITYKVHEPKLLLDEKEEVKGLYTTFAEVELEIENINLVFAIVIRMLPSHVEIIDPDDVYLKNFDLSAILNDLAIKLHKYDEVAKILMMERDNFARQLNAIHNNIIKNVKAEEINNQGTENKKGAKEENAGIDAKSHQIKKKKEKK